MSRAEAVASEHNICHRIRQLRRGIHWSQSDMVSKLTDAGFAMHQTTYAKLEEGKRPLRVAELHAIADIFNLTPESFYSDEPVVVTGYVVRAVTATA